MALAKPTSEEVFRSFKENMSSDPSTGSMLPFLLAGAALIILLVVIASRQKHSATPKAVNHPGKLLKEIAKSAGIKPSEIKKLKNLAQQAGERQGAALQSPLTLVLCPSVLAATMRQTKAKR
ncbi:MAG: hypothetical protein IT447_01765 [Phycisphaerales bacterium]|jgi:hypothetical protein|nr:hypothetical protein [Phycisphaerales bacterium]